MFHGYYVYLPIIVTNVVVLSSCFSILHEYSPLSSISQSFIVSRQIPDISLAVSYLSPSYVTWETNLYIYITTYNNETAMSSFTHFKFVYQTLLFHLSKIYFISTAYSGTFIYNKLSHEIKSVKCIIKFKKVLINFLTEDLQFCRKIYDYRS